MNGDLFVFGLLTLCVVSANLIGLPLFALDKRAAIADRRRVPERTLLALAAAGAAPAMIALSGIIRHKTRKQPFATLLRLIALTQAAVLIAIIVWPWL